MIDLVIPLEGITRNDKFDVRYLLRSFCKNFVDLGKVFIITEGDLPWAKDITVIQYGDFFRHNKDANLIGKVYVTCLRKELSSDFVRASDDQILLKKIIAKDFKNYGYGDMRQIVIQNSNWQRRFYATRDKLLSEKKPCINYEVHMPMLMNKEKYKEIMLKYDWWVDRQGYVINSLYFNNCFNRMYDDANKIKYSCEQPISINDLVIMTHGKTFLGYGEKTRGLVHSMLKNMFPDKCKFEK